MSENYRVKINLNNKSFFVGQGSATGMGATVIPADRGPMTPTRLNRGETDKICMLFGANRFEVLEAIAYNNKYPLWISAPHNGGAHGCALLTDIGLIPVPISYAGNPYDQGIINFNNLCYQYKLGIGNGNLTTFGINTISTELIESIETDDLPKRAEVLIGDKPYSTEITWQADRTFSFTTFGNGSGGSISEGRLIVNLSLDTAPAEGTPLSFRLYVDTSKLIRKVFAIIGMKFPCSDFMTVAVYKSNIEGRLMLSVQNIRKGVARLQGGYPIEFSLKQGTTNGSGVNIYAPELLRNDDFIFVMPNSDEELNLDTWTASSTIPTPFTGGFRGVAVNSTMLAKGWNQYKEFKKYPADIYFDITADAEIPSVLAGLRESILYKRFLFPVQRGLTATEACDLPPRPSSRGLCAFWGEAFIRNPFEPTGNLLSTLMGEVASRYADAVVLSYGGRSVAWGDENGVGGQLNQGRIVEFLYDAKEHEMKELDRLRINPIIMNELFGPIVASRRTTDTSDTDYSYSDYSMIIDYCVERIVNEVLPFQLIKFNDDNHRAVVRMKSELILKPLVQPPNNVLRNFAIKCDAENNGDDVLSRQEFVLSVAIQVTPKAEFIVFNFINSAQGGSVEEDVL